jgi:L-arabinose isomerase
MATDPNVKSPVKIGLFGIGHAPYWPQFEGLRDRLLGYQAQIADQLTRPGVEVVNCGLVDDAQTARDVGKKLKEENVSIIFLYISTYALSSNVLPVVQTAHVPVVVLNLQPVAAIDYKKFNAMGDRTKMTGEWLAHCQACSVPEVANVFSRAGVDFHQVTGVLTDDPTAWDEISAWIEAVRVAQIVRENRVGVLGHYYGGMLDIYTDLTQQSAVFGNHFEHLEMCELKELREAVKAEQIDAKIEQLNAEFEIWPDCSLEEIRRSAKTACALDALVEQHQLGSLAYFYNGTGDSDYEDLIASVIVGNTMLTSRGVPVAGEYEIKNVQAMKILDAFGAGGSFTEFYAMDFNEDIVLMGHDGPGHSAIAEGRVRLKPLKVYHGKVGQGLSVEMSVKHGPVTVLSVIDSEPGKIKLLIAEGESVPGPILQIGNTNSRYRFSLGARGFVDRWSRNGPAHHCAIGVGHLSEQLKKLASLFGIEAIRVC